jgi:hypothetical protein
MIWYALAIPCIFTLIAYFIWHSKFVIFELFIPLIASFFTILISYYTLKNVNMRDVEYNGYVIKEARYYEYWESWEERTCSYTTCNGYDSKGHCTGYTTHYYDCSYCDNNSAYWVAIDNFGHNFYISEEKYKQLIQKWSATPEFNELNRNIDYHGSCGQDGDMYSIKWDNKIETSECSVIEVPFENIVKVSHSAFQYPQISDEEADTLKLYRYPEHYDYYKQPAILGLSQYQFADTNYIRTKFEFLNGNLGPSNKVKVFTLLFKNKPIDIAFKQEAYWSGGNQNELVVCIGLKDDFSIEWVKPFSWCDNKRIIVDTREDIANLKYFDTDSIYNIYESNINKYFHYKSFKDFNYLTFEPTVTQIVFVYFITLAITILTLWFCIKNDLTNNTTIYPY